MIELDRCLDRTLIVGRANILVITERMVVHILVEGGVERGKGGQVERGVEVDRRARQLCIARLEVKFRRRAYGKHQSSIKAKILLIVDGLRIEEDVAIEAVGLAVIGGHDEADIGRYRSGEIGRGFERIVRTVTDPGTAGENLSRIERGNDDRASGGIATVYRALRTLEHLDLAQGALVLIELRSVGLEDSIDHQSDRAFCVARAVDAADVDLGITRFRRSGDDRHARGQLNELVGRLDARNVERLGRQHGDRRRDVEQSFILSPRGNHDFIRRIIGRRDHCRCRCCRRRGRRIGGLGQSGGRQQRAERASGGECHASCRHLLSPAVVCGSPFR